MVMARLRPSAGSYQLRDPPVPAETLAPPPPAPPLATGLPPPLVEALLLGAPPEPVEAALVVPLIGA